MGVAFSDATLVRLKWSDASAQWNLEFAPCVQCNYLFLFRLLLSILEASGPVCPLRLHAMAEQRL